MTRRYASYCTLILACSCGARGGGTTTGGVSTGGSPGSGGTRDAGPPVPLPTPDTTGCLYGDLQVTPESLSYDGRWFVLSEGEEVILYERTTQSMTQISRSLTSVDPPSLSGDGNRVLFGAGSGNDSNAFVWDRITDGMFATFPVGDAVMGVLSRDGRFLAFDSRDPAFTDPPPYFQGGAIVVDLSTNERWQASVNDNGEAGADYSFSSDVSDDGQRVVFRSVAMNLVPGKPERRWDVYMYDRATQRTVLAAAAIGGGYADAYTMDVRISGDGRTVAFESQASDIVAGDSPDTYDLFTWDVGTSAVRTFTFGHSIEQPLALVNLSTDGRFVLLRGDSDDFVPDERNGKPDAFVYDRALDRFDLVSRAYDGSPLVEGGEPVALSGDGRVVAFRTQSPELVGDRKTMVCFSVREP